MSLIHKMNVGNTDYDIQDRLMPDTIGQAGQVLKVKDDGSGLEFSTDRKLYRHLLKGTANAYFVSGSSVTSPVEYEMIFITDSRDSMKVDDSTAQNDKLGEYAGCYITAYGTVSVKTSDEVPGNYYAFDACGFKHEGSPGIYSVSYLYMYDPTKYRQLNALTKVSTQIATVDSDTITEL